jgi:hypothetical protein
MNVDIEWLDMDIGYALDLANEFTSAVGIKKKPAKTKVVGEKKSMRLPLNLDGTVCWSCIGVDWDESIVPSPTFPTV